MDHTQETSQPPAGSSDDFNSSPPGARPPPIKTAKASRSPPPKPATPFLAKNKNTQSRMDAMEGLIPFIYKAVTRRTRSYYSRCSSTGSSRGRFGARVEDSSWESATGKVTTTAEREMVAHRRHRSLEELAGEVGASPEWRRRALPRGRSVRFFSCIGGM